MECGTKPNHTSAGRFWAALCPPHTLHAGGPTFARAHARPALPPERMRGLVALATAMRRRCTATSRPWAVEVGR